MGVCDAVFFSPTDLALDPTDEDEDEELSQFKPPHASTLLTPTTP